MKKSRRPSIPQQISRPALFENLPAPGCHVPEKNPEMIERGHYFSSPISSNARSILSRKSRASDTMVPASSAVIDASIL